MGPSWKNRASLPVIFSIIFILHLLTLMINLNFAPNELKSSDSKSKALNVKLKTLELKKQIVASEDSELSEKKENAFLSDKDRSFDRETKARNIDVFRNSQPAEGFKKAGKKNLKLSDLGSLVGSDPFKEVVKNAKKPGNDSKGKVHQVSSTNDYLPEVPLGDVTHLNSVEYKYYGFYHRIKQKLEQFWGRSLHEKASLMAQEGRRISSADELITALKITLDADGEIIDISIQSTSGIKELDDAAVESFNEAGPFPNPPRDLIVNGRVTLEWGFVVSS